MSKFNKGDLVNSQRKTFGEHYNDNQYDSNGKKEAEDLPSRSPEEVAEMPILNSEKEERNSKNPPRNLSLWKKALLVLAAASSIRIPFEKEGSAEKDIESSKDSELSTMGRAAAFFTNLADAIPNFPPVVGAANVGSKKKKGKKDKKNEDKRGEKKEYDITLPPEFERLLKEKIMLDTEYPASEASLEHFRKEFKKAAKEGPHSAEIMTKCLKEIEGIYILSMDAKTKQKLGYNYVQGGAYRPFQNTLFLFDYFQGKYSLNVLLHECNHLWQFRQGISYDEEKMTKCYDNILKQGIEMVRCIDERPAQNCEDVDFVAKQYAGRLSISNCPPGVPKGGIDFNIQEVDSKYPNLEKTTLKVRFTPDNKNPQYCVVTLKEILREDQRTKVKVSKDEFKKVEDRFVAATSLVMRTPRETIQTYKTRGNEALQNREAQVVFIEQVPQAARDFLCPEGLGDYQRDVGLPIGATSQEVKDYVFGMGGKLVPQPTKKIEIADGESEEEPSKEFKTTGARKFKKDVDHDRVEF